MTRIKYATIGHVRETDRLIISRGKKTGEIGYLPGDDEDAIFGDPIHSERVVELPEKMTPTEYEEYVDETLCQDPDDPVTQAMIGVAEDLDIDYREWDWPALEDGDAE